MIQKIRRIGKKNGEFEDVEKVISSIRIVTSSIRIEVKGREYLITEVAEGFKIVLCENTGALLIRPQTGNSVIVTDENVK